AQGALMGVHSDDSASLPPDQQGVVKLEQALGRTMDINNHYHGAFDDFAKHGMGKLEQWDVDAGRIPLVGSGCPASDKVASGSLDGIIHATAQKMKAFGHELVLRYCREMDGDRRQCELKRLQKLIAAWQRMPTTRQHGKPIRIGEYGAQEQSQDPEAKPKWMRMAHETLMKKPRTADCPWCGAYSDVAAVVYFDVNYGPHGDWRIMSSEASFQAYREAAGDPYFHQLETVSW